jgi:hypothetical protein
MDEPTLPVPPKRANITQLQTAGAIAGFSVLVLLGLQAPFVFIKSPLPYMATPGHKVRQALEYIHKNREVGNSVFVDLGSGDGEAVYQALRFGYSQAVGIELNFTLWAFASIRRKLFWPFEYQRRSRIIWGNFFSYNLREADAVMIFGVRPLMESISRKIASECRTGTHILAHRFPLHTNDSRGTNTSGLDAKIIYYKEDMRVYKCR